MKSRYSMAVLLWMVATAGSACAQEQSSGRLEPLGEGVAAAAMSIDPDDYIRKLGIIAHARDSTTVVVPSLDHASSSLTAAA